MADKPGDAVDASDASEKPAKKSVTVWDFLNSTFGIWLLSSVVLTGVVQMIQYTASSIKESEARNERKAQEESKRREIYERISIEVAYRISTTLSRLRSAHINQPKANPAEQRVAINKSLDLLRLPANADHPSLYPEYQSYSGIALIAELRRHAKENESESLAGVIAKTSVLIEDQMLADEASGLPAKEVAQELLRRVRYPTWNVGFAYVSCSAQDPFC